MVSKKIRSARSLRQRGCSNPKGCVIPPIGVGHQSEGQVAAQIFDVLFRRVKHNDNFHARPLQVRRVTPVVREMHVAHGACRKTTELRVDELTVRIRNCQDRACGRAPGEILDALSGCHSHVQTLSRRGAVVFGLPWCACRVCKRKGSAISRSSFGFSSWTKSRAPGTVINPLQSGN